ncbi:MAG TPA: hypothetical protein VNQ52_08850 [Microbacteriaceae bacterium]|nr:hypothetical protein [Microbacteriaceae bacterium]
MGKVWKRTIPTPWDGVPGFWAAWNRFFFFFEGSAQVGIEGEERPQLAPEEQHCPLCGEPMPRHDVDRSGPGGRTILHCPTKRVHQEPGE